MRHRAARGARPNQRWPKFVHFIEIPTRNKHQQPRKRQKRRTLRTTGKQSYSHFEILREVRILYNHRCTFFCRAPFKIVELCIPLNMDLFKCSQDGGHAERAPREPPFIPALIDGCLASRKQFCSVCIRTACPLQHQRGRFEYRWTAGHQGVRTPHDASHLRTVQQAVVFVHRDDDTCHVHARTLKDEGKGLR